MSRLQDGRDVVEGASLLSGSAVGSSNQQGPS